MAKKILTVGCELASTEVDEASFDSYKSLLDYDIIIFKPSVSRLLAYTSGRFQGQPCPDDDTSYRIKSYTQHWRNEILEAVAAGKVVVAFLSGLVEAQIATGEKQYSGTGRNQAVKRIVTSYNNYSSIPAELSPRPASGKAMKLARDSDFMLPLWNVFEEQFVYRVLIAPDRGKPVVLTRSGDKTAGAIFRNAASGGALLVLPDVDFQPDEFFRATKAGNVLWSDEGKKFGAQMVSAVVAVAQALRSTVEATPPPSWTSGNAFELPAERGLRAELLVAQTRVEQAQLKAEQVATQLADAGRLRGLLFEKGKALEDVIILGLSHLGFAAAPYRDAGSEFDVVFECPEGRLLGEAEGKDNKAVNIDKLRQLAMNLHEDLQREEVSSLAKGVLFGNAFRLAPPHERSEQFTEKCVAAAESSSVSLVTTSDLFQAVQYLAEVSDPDYARACREAMLNGNGLVALPAAPSREQSSAIVEMEPSPSA